MAEKRKNDVMVEDWEVNNSSQPRVGSEVCIKEIRKRPVDRPGAIDI